MSFLHFLRSLDVPADAEDPAIESGTSSITYGSFRSFVGHFQEFLDRWVSSRGIVALCSYPPIWPAILTAVIRSGRVFLPTTATDSALGARASLLQARPECLVGHSDGLTLLLESLPARATYLESLHIPDIASPIQLVSLVWDGARSEGTIPDDVCYLMPTSGSTGRPKIVMGSLTGLAHFIDWEVDQLDLKPRTRVTQLTPPTFDPVLRDIFVALSIGGVVLMPPSRGTLADPEALTRWIDSSHATVVHCIPTLFRGILRQSLAAEMFMDLRYIALAGEQLYSSDVSRWFDVFDDRIQLLNLYGPTETTLAKFAHWISKDDLRGERISVGFPIRGANALLVDSSKRVCPPGQVGEIIIRTQFRSHGYLGGPDLTRASFIPNPFGTDENDLVYQTGDLGIIRDDGRFEIVGRTDDFVKIRGVRVQLSLVEACIRQLLPHADVAVTVVRDTSNRELIAAYLASRSRLDLKDLRERLVDELPSQMRPQEVVQLEELPRTCHGKLDKSVLPSPNRFSRPSNAVASAYLDGSVLEVWRSILPGSAEISLDDDFYVLGGQSIEAAQIVGTLSRRFSVDLTLRTFLRQSTPSAVASAIARLIASCFSLDEWQSLVARLDLAPEARQLALADDDASRVEFIRGLGRDPLEALIAVLSRRTLNPPYDEPLSSVSIQAHAPLSFAQERFWRLDQRRAGNPNLVYGWAALLEGRFDMDRLARALDRTVNRHTAIRTEFISRHGEVLQRHALPQPFIVQIEDWSRTGIDRLMHHLVSLAQTPFDLGCDLLLRAFLFSLSTSSCLLFLNGHVIVSDGWSKAILLRELSTSFNSDKVESPCKGPLYSFLDFAHWERRALPYHLQRFMPYWRSHFASGIPSFPLPYDFPTTSEVNSEGDEIVSTVDGPTVQTFVSFARDRGTTQNALLVSCFVIALAIWSRKDQVVLVIPTANRARREFESMVGSFTDGFIFSIHCDWNLTFSRWVAHVARELNEAVENAYVPLEVIMDTLFPTSDKYAPSLLPVMFSPQLPLEGDLRLDGIQVTEVSTDLKTAIFNIHVFTYVRSQQIQIRFNFSTRVFRKETVQRLANLTIHILIAGLTFPNRRLCVLDGLAVPTP